MQEDEITFYLYNQHTSDLKLTKNNLCEVELDKDVTWVGRVTEALLSIIDYNVIQVDWSGLAVQPDPYLSFSVTDAGMFTLFMLLLVMSAALFCLGYFISKVIGRLHKLESIPLNKIYLDGQSLRAQIISFAGKHMRNALRQKSKKSQD